MNAKLVAVAAGLAAMFLSVPSASAEDGAWKTGSSYVIRFEHLDLSRPADRQALLVQVERSAAKLCAGERIKARRNACVASAISSALNISPAQVRLAVQTARNERDSQQQAQR